MVLTKDFETLEQVRLRTNMAAEKIIDQVRTEMRNGNVACRFRDAGEQKITEFKRKEGEK